MKLCSVAYLPPRSIGHAEIFLGNLSKFPTKHPLLLLSDQDYPQRTGTIVAPEDARQFRDHSTGKMDFSINNCIFLRCMSEARKQGFTHAIYIECDSRVGVAGWDEQIFAEFFATGKPAMCGGSVVCYNPFNGGKEGADAFNELIRKHNTKRNFPVAAYQPQVKAFGFKSSADHSGSAIFPNGSLSVWDLAFYKDLLGAAKSAAQTAGEWGPWDMELGKLMWAKYRAGAYELVNHLKTVYSSYGDALTTEDERLEMLRAGTVVGVHQVKSGATA